MSEQSDPRDLRTVLQAAIRQDCEVYTLPKPFRHHDIMYGPMDGVYKHSLAEQGFLTSDGRFVGREVAARFALRSGQILALKHPPNLYTEDLW